MNLIATATANEQSEIDAPPAVALKLFRVLFVVFLFSFVFDYR